MAKKKSTKDWMISNEHWKFPGGKSRNKLITLRVIEDQREKYKAAAKALRTTTTDFFIEAA